MNGTTEKPVDPAARPEQVARTLAQAALQATCRAMHTAQMAVDAAGRLNPNTDGAGMVAAAMVNLRDAIADAYAASPEPTRRAILAAPGTIGGDELLDLLATLVRAREGRSTVTTETAAKKGIGHDE